MKSQIAKLGIAACLLAAAMLLSEEAEARAKWRCTYVGTWKTKGKPGRAGFKWSVLWTHQRGQRWRMTGNYKDKYGRSYLDGFCKNKYCRFYQLYKSGSFRGRRFYWQGRYKDKWYGKRKTVNRFRGTWGYSAAKRHGGGTWKAIATCRKIK